MFVIDATADSVLDYLVFAPTVFQTSLQKTRHPMFSIAVLMGALQRQALLLLHCAKSAAYPVVKMIVSTKLSQLGAADASIADASRSTSNDAIDATPQDWTLIQILKVGVFFLPQPASSSLAAWR